MSQAVHDPCGLLARVKASARVRSDIHPNEQSSTAYCRDRPVARGELLKPFSQIGAGLTCVREQAFAPDHIEDGERDCARNRVAAKSIEITRAPRKLRNCFRAYRQRRNRMSIAQRLSHSDEVRHDAVALETPHVPGAAKASLHFVRDEKPSRIMDCAHSPSQETLGLRHYTIARKNGVDEQPGRLDAIGMHGPDAAAHPRAELFCVSAGDRNLHGIYA